MNSMQRQSRLGFYNMLGLPRRFAQNLQLLFFRDLPELMFVSLYLQPFVGAILTGICIVFNACLCLIGSLLIFTSSCPCKKFCQDIFLARFGGKT
jgi:hypothetical protein